MSVIHLTCLNWSYKEGQLEWYTLAVPSKYRSLLTKHAAYEGGRWISCLREGSMWLQLPGVVVA